MKVSLSATLFWKLIMTKFINLNWKKKIIHGMDFFPNNSWTAILDLATPSPRSTCLSTGTTNNEKIIMVNERGEGIRSVRTECEMWTPRQGNFSMGPEWSVHNIWYLAPTSFFLFHFELFRSVLAASFILAGMIENRIMAKREYKASCLYSLACTCVRAFSIEGFCLERRVLANKSISLLYTSYWKKYHAPRLKYFLSEPI